MVMVWHTCSDLMSPSFSVCDSKWCRALALAASYYLCAPMGGPRPGSGGMRLGLTWPRRTGHRATRRDHGLQFHRRPRMVEHAKRCTTCCVDTWCVHRSARVYHHHLNTLTWLLPTNQTPKDIIFVVVPGDLKVSKSFKSDFIVFDKGIPSGYNWGYTRRICQLSHTLSFRVSFWTVMKKNIKNF